MKRLEKVLVPFRAGFGECIGCRVSFAIESVGIELRDGWTGREVDPDVASAAGSMQFPQPGRQIGRRQAGGAGLTSVIAVAERVVQRICLCRFGA